MSNGVGGRPPIAMKSTKVYGGGQPIPVTGPTTTTTTPMSAAGSSVSAARPSTPSSSSSSSSSSRPHLNFGSMSSAQSAQRADYSGAGSDANYTASSASNASSSSSSSSSSVGWNIARAVGNSILYPLAAVGAVSASSSSLTAAATPSSHHTSSSIISSYDPHLANFPLLPRFNGSSADGALYSVPFASSSSNHPRRHHNSAITHAAPAAELAGQNLSSILNAISSPADEVEPPPFVLTPLVGKEWNESVAAITQMVRDYQRRCDISGEWIVYSSHHGTYSSPRDPHARDSESEHAEVYAQRQFALCRKTVPGRYFAADFSVAAEAMTFYEAQLAAAAAEADDENTSSSTASSFYSTFSTAASPQPNTRGNGIRRQDSLLQSPSSNSTYFQAAWAATHTQSTANDPSTASSSYAYYVPGFVSPAKAAASLYKLFNKVTGTVAPTPSSASSQQQLVPSQQRQSLNSTMNSKSKMNGFNYSHPSAASSEDVNALELQQRLAGYLDCVEVTIMSLVGSKSKAFFSSLTSIQLLNTQVESAVHVSRSLRHDIKVLDENLVKATLHVVHEKRVLHNALQLEALIVKINEIHQVTHRIKHFISQNEFHSAIELIHSTLNELKTPQIKKVKCLTSMEVKLNEYLKLIMMMISQANKAANGEVDSEAEHDESDTDSQHQQQHQQQQQPSHSPDQPQANLEEEEYLAIIRDENDHHDMKDDEEDEAINQDGIVNEEDGVLYSPYEPQSITASKAASGASSATTTSSLATPTNGFMKNLSTRLGSAKWMNTNGLQGWKINSAVNGWKWNTAKNKSTTNES